MSATATKPDDTPSVEPKQARRRRRTAVRGAAASRQRAHSVPISKSATKRSSSPYDAEIDRLPLTVSRETAQQISGLSVRTFDRVIASGSLRSIKIGRRRMIPREDLRRWLIAHLEAG